MMEIKPEDIEEKFIRSRGKGGQNVNKVATCVQLKHIPTGIAVKCDVHRTQAKNREEAMKLLIEKIEKKANQQREKEISDKEKIKRQNRKRPHSLQEQILDEKKIQSEKKKLRKRIV